MVCCPVAIRATTRASNWWNLWKVTAAVGAAPNRSRAQCRRWCYREGSPLQGGVDGSSPSYEFRLSRSGRAVTVQRPADRFNKIAGKQVLRRGLSPLVATLSTEHGAPVIAGIRLRAGRAGSGKGAASMVTEAIRTTRAAG